MFAAIQQLQQQDLQQVLKLVEKDNIWSSISWQIALSNNQVFGIYTQNLPKQAPVEFSQEECAKKPLALSAPLIPDTRFLIPESQAPVEFSGYLAGCLVLNFIEKIAELEQLFVADFLRNLGIGGFLLDFAIDFARQKNCEQMWLEVRESNASAISLYQKKGFIHTGTRKNYYKNTQTNSTQSHENAHLFSLSLN